MIVLSPPGRMLLQGKKVIPARLRSEDIPGLAQLFSHLEVTADQVDTTTLRAQLQLLP